MSKDSVSLLNRKFSVVSAEFRKTRTVVHLSVRAASQDLWDITEVCKWFLAV